MASKKEARGNRKSGYYKVQALRTARNKTNRNLKRIRLAKTRPLQERVVVGNGPDGDTIIGTVINRAKQSRRKARNLQRRNRLLHARAAAELVLPVVEATAE